jgi:hypothetical protein
MNCASCGDVLPFGARYCITCGRAVATTGPTERLDTSALYVAQEEYDRLLCDPCTLVSHPCLPGEQQTYYRNQRVIIREAT